VRRTFVSFPIPDFQLTRRQLLTWADNRFGICCFLDNHGYALPGHSIECILAAGAVDAVEADAGEAFERVARFAAGKKDWLFGHFGYGLAKETEPPQVVSPSGRFPGGFADRVGFPDLFFFVPQIVIELIPGSSGSIRIGSFNRDHTTILQEIAGTPVPANPMAYSSDPKSGLKSGLKARFSREEYIATVKRLQQHILRGDCYEINFCQEFYSSPANIDPLQTWFALSRNSPNPFAAYYKLEQRYLLCASPERYLKRIGNTLLSQPIKGTWPRHTAADNNQETADDQAGADQLYHSGKDRSENVMVVDLVRNDLSKLCTEGSVKVTELYGVYTFPHVHQMVSSIQGELLPGTGFADCVRASFPMGSMTGAPKNRVVDLIRQVERSPRNIFSGSVGYVDPDGDFDFNVVIRSILYNRRDGYLSYQVGSGITFYSDPQGEYEECLLKAEGIKKALGI
jgi:para-aminobenzoate synthetase component 1